MGSPLTPVLVNLLMGYHETYGWQNGKLARLRGIVVDNTFRLFYLQNNVLLLSIM